MAIGCRVKTHAAAAAASARQASAATPLAESKMEDEEARKAEKPIVDAAAAVELAAQLYGLTCVAGTIKELDSYDDRNFYFRALPAVAPPDTDANATDDGSGAFHY
eukprot:1829503-Prymnesium_polylepis.1